MIFKACVCPGKFLSMFSETKHTAYFPNPGGAEGKKRSSGSQVTDAVNSEGRTVIFSFVFSLPDTTGLPA